MSFESDIYGALTTSTEIAALVGDRIFADVADSGTAAPYLVYQIISVTGETLHDRTRDIEFPIVQVSAWAETAAESIAIAKAVRTTLEAIDIEGDSDLTLSFSDRNSERDQETNLFGQIIEYRGACNSN